MCTESKILQMKSLSEEDLGSITKKMINCVLDDKEQLAKLHRAIYEELCFEATQKLSITEIENEPRKVTSEENVICEISKTENIEAEELKNCEIIKTEDDAKLQVKFKDCKNERTLDDLKQKNEQAFKNWKKEKTKARRRAWKEERDKRQRELITKQNEIEKKRACRAAYIREKKMQVSQRKTELTKKKTKKDECLRLLEQENVRIAANEEAFRAWMKQKQSQLRQRYQPRRRISIMKTNDEFKFDAWLCQLNLVLNEKYMRERRQRSRSLYCRPIVCGANVLSTN